MKSFRAIAINTLLLSGSTVHSFTTIPPASGLAVARFQQPSSAASSSFTTHLHNNAPRHDVRGGEGMTREMDPEELKIQAALAEHQQNAPKLGFPTDVRTLIQYNHGFAVMSTNSKAWVMNDQCCTSWYFSFFPLHSFIKFYFLLYRNPGFPGGSVVGFAPDDKGRPVFIVSSFSHWMKFFSAWKFVVLFLGVRHTNNDNSSVECQPTLKTS